MAKKTQEQPKAAVVLRNGWLAYLGIYGAAFDRVKPQVETIRERATEIFGDLVAKGENVEATAQEVAADVRERATGFYGEGVSRVRGFMPRGVAANDRINELEAEVEVLTKKINALAKKAPAKRTVKAKAA